MVIAINPIYLYENATFKQSERLAYYAKKDRADAPMFVVIGIDYSSAGRLRYKVRDVNHLSKTNGMVGYITANSDYVVPAYYSELPKMITIVNPKGVNSYAKENLTGKKAHHKQGDVLTVVGMVHHNKTTRFVLSDGSFVTANKKLVEAGKVNTVSSVTVKHTVYKYATAQLTGKKGKVKAGQTLKVFGYVYSNANDLSKKGTLRLRVAGGYITGNNVFVTKHD